MTVYELIQQLSKYSSDTEVIIGKGKFLTTDTVVGSVIIQVNQEQILDKDTNTKKQIVCIDHE